MGDNSEQGLTRKLAKNGAALAIGGLVAQIAVIAVEIVMARGLGAAAYGVFATTYAFALLSIYLFDVGTTWWTVQEGSRRPERLPALLGNSLVLKTTLFAALYACVMITLYAVDIPADIFQFVALFGLFALGLALVDTLAAVYTARQEMHVNAVYQALSPLAILIIYLVAASDGVSLNDAALAYVLGSGLVGLAWLWRTAKTVGISFRLADAIGLPRRSYHYGFSGILRHVFYKTDIVMIAFLLGAAEAGIYAAAVKFLDLFNKIPVLLNRVVSPALFAESHRKTTARFEVLVSGYSRLLVTLGAMASIVTFIAADELVHLVFGEGYALSASVLRILSAAMILKCMMTVGEAVLSSLDKHTARWACLGTTVVVNVVINLALSPRFGGEGAALATIVSGLLLIALYLGFGFGRERIARASLWFGVPALMGTAVVVLVQSTGFPVLLSVPLALCVFTILLFLTRLTSVGELASLKASLTGRALSHHS